MSFKSLKETYGHAVSRGKVPSADGVVKFGRAPTGVQTTRTTLWARADSATPTQQLYTAPTVPRTHTITGGAADTAAGTGAQVVRIWYIADWATSTEELTEDVTMNGAGGATTTATMIHINRIRVVRAGTGETNSADIVATADTDATVSAVVPAGKGSTQQALYGVPKGKALVVSHFYGEASRSGGAVATVNFSLEDLDYSGTNPVRVERDVLGVQSTGNSTVSKKYDVGVRFTGPCIVQITATASANGTDAEAGFEGVLAEEVVGVATQTVP